MGVMNRGRTAGGISTARNTTTLRPDASDAWQTSSHSPIHWPGAKGNSTPLPSTGSAASPRGRTINPPIDSRIGPVGLIPKEQHLNENQVSNSSGGGG
jgi:hypothetical protein